MIKLFLAVYLFGVLFSSSVSAEQAENELLQPEETQASEDNSIGLLSQDIQAQLDQINVLLETEDAFSSKLSESYFSYGRLLQEAGDYKQAREAYTSAMHIEKINHGIYSIEQRPLLKAIFDVDFAQRDEEKINNHVQRMMWLEDKNNKYDDDLGFKMLVKAGIFNLEKYYQSKRASETNLAVLRSAKTFFLNAIERYKDQPLEKLNHPFDELALSLFFERLVANKLGQTILGRDTRSAYNRTVSPLDERSGFSRDRKQIQYQVIEQNYPRILSKYLNKYIEKAKQEENSIGIAKAFILNGDYFLFAGDINQAHQMYEEAWQELQNISEPNLTEGLLSKPVQLPAVDFLSQGVRNTSRYPSIKLPVSININSSGLVEQIDQTGENTEEIYTKRIKNALYKTQFRPIVSNGKVTGVQNFEYEVTVRKKQ